MDALKDLLDLRDAVDFHQGAQGQPFHGKGGARRFPVGKIRGVDFVHGRKVPHVREQNGGLDHL